jgi:hypothetical protein
MATAPRTFFALGGILIFLGILALAYAGFVSTISEPSAYLSALVSAMLFTFGVGVLGFAAYRLRSRSRVSEH